MSTDRLLAEVNRVGRKGSAAILGCSEEYVESWFPRINFRSGRIESGLEPSAGFTAAALAELSRH